MLPDPEYYLVDLLDNDCGVSRVLDEVSWCFAGRVERGYGLVEVRADFLDLGCCAG
jgi:hypothetical protein